MILEMNPIRKKGYHPLLSAQVSCIFRAGGFSLLSREKL